MDVKEAVRTAREYLADYFELDDRSTIENIKNVRLEEIKFDDWSSTWNITIGFSRSSADGSATGTSESMLSDSPETRSYKVIRVNKESGHVESLKDRFLMNFD